MQEVPLRRYHFAEFGSGFGCHVHPVGSKWGVPGLSEVTHDNPMKNGAM